jgi:hypothetical protein
LQLALLVERDTALVDRQQSVADERVPGELRLQDKPHAGDVEDVTRARVIAT